MSYTPHDVSDASDKVNDILAKYTDTKYELERLEAELKLAKLELHRAMDNHPELYKPRSERTL